LDLRYSCSTRLINYLAFRSFNFECIWWRLSQKCIVCTTLDIYVCITSWAFGKLVWTSCKSVSWLPVNRKISKVAHKQGIVEYFSYLI
jgi:hypothetical protein